MNESFKTDIVILGAGIGGYEAYRTLKKQLKKMAVDAHITIVDQNNYFTFIPLLHEVATGSVEPTHASIPLRELVYNTPHTFINASVERVDHEKKQVYTSRGIIEFNYCIIALGSEVNFYGVPGAREYTHQVRTLEDALDLKYALVEEMEHDDKEECVVTIVGGGFVGVEIAGQYGMLKKGDLRKLYPHKKLIVRVIEPNPNILGQLELEVQKHVHQRLEKLGVEFVFNTSVTEVTKEGIVLKNGERLSSDITVWSAGFANLGAEFVGEENCERGRIKVDEYLRLVGHESCYAIGDIAFARDGVSGKPCVQLAEVAHKAGQYVGRHLAASLAGRNYEKFVFKSRGQLMPVGDWYGVAIFNSFTFYGWFAWWLRRTVYLMYMPGILRKLRIMIDWTVHSFGFGHFILIEKHKE